MAAYHDVAELTDPSTTLHLPPTTTAASLKPKQDIWVQLFGRQTFGHQNMTLP